MEIKFDVLVSHRPLKKIIQLYSEKLYLVGGPVRDLLLNKSFTDIDLVCERRENKLIDALILNFRPKKVVKSLFFTTKLYCDGFEIDVAQAREESYSYPGALPRVSPCYDIIKDLKRRDFTINSMAISLKPGAFDIIDPLGGMEDLRNRVLRVNKKGSFVDDPTRAFRAIRYSKRLKFKYALETLEEFSNAREYIKNVSFDRLKREVQKCVMERERLEILSEIAEKGLLDSWREGFSLRNKELLKSLHYVLPYEGKYWFYFLIPFGFLDFFSEVSQSLASEEKKAMNTLIERKPPKKISPGELYKVMKGLSPLQIRVWGLYYEIDESKISEYLEKFSTLKPSVKLRDLIEKTSDPAKARLAYEKYISLLLDGEIAPGMDWEVLLGLIKEDS
ncbi:MAG: hypothetical protein ACPLN0_00615 [Candidatus Hydrothermia bacterium]